MHARSATSLSMCLRTPTKRRRIRHSYKIYSPNTWSRCSPGAYEVRWNGTKVMTSRLYLKRSQMQPMSTLTTWMPSPSTWGQPMRELQTRTIASHTLLWRFSLWLRRLGFNEWFIGDHIKDKTPTAGEIRDRTKQMFPHVLVQGYPVFTNTKKISLNESMWCPRHMEREMQMLPSDDE
jgi:hypothetical protein